jgi:hypothetical protein
LDIEIWDGGLQEQEIEAIKKIKGAFSGGPLDEKSPSRSTSIRDQFQSKLGRNGMYPWKG